MPVPLTGRLRLNLPDEGYVYRGQPLVVVEVILGAFILWSAILVCPVRYPEHLPVEPLVEGLVPGVGLVELRLALIFSPETLPNAKRVMSPGPAYIFP